MSLQLSSAQKKHILVLLFLIPFLLGIGIDLYVPSLPAIKHYFQAPKTLVQLTIGLYVLGYAFAQLLLGVLSDSLGRKKILVVSGMLYTLISFMGVFSVNIEMLLLCRILQGCAIAGASVVCRAIVADCFTGLARAKAMTYFSTSWAFGPVIGPFIGGYLQDYFNWQANFYFFGIYGLLTFVYAAIVLPETHLHLAPVHPRKIAKTVFEVMSHPQFMRYAMIASLIYAMLVVFNVIAPFLIQETLHYSAIAYGQIALLLGVGNFLGNFVNFWILHYLSIQKITLYSLIAALGMGLILLLMGLFIQPNLYIIMLPIFFLFFFCGFIFPNIMTMNMNLFSTNAGTSSAIFGSWVSGGVAVFSTIATLLGTETQVPLAMMYLGICVICVVLFCCSKR